MRTLLTLLTLGLAWLAGSFAANAQFVHGTYYECDIIMETRADELVASTIGAVADEQIAAGLIGAWGWLGHFNGGAWRRLLYMVGDDTDGITDARDNLIQALQTRHPSVAREFTSICGKHDDYIWVRGTGSAPAGEITGDRPEAGFSIYFECDDSRLDRADEIVDGWTEMHNGMVSDGMISSWSWMHHMVGGPFDRIAVYDAADHKAMLKAIGAMVEELETNHKDEFTEFGGICSSHQDYMWDIQIAKPGDG